MTHRPPAPAAEAAELPLADRVAAAVLEVEGVADLHAGAFGEVATYLPGRRVAGVRLREGSCEVHVVTIWGVDVRRTAARVREAVGAVSGTPVQVVVEDVAPPRGQQ